MQLLALIAVFPVAVLAIVCANKSRVIDCVEGMVLGQPLLMGQVG